MIVLSLGLVACGSNNDEPNYQQNGYYVGGGPGLATCPPRVAQDWNRFIASRCNNVHNIVGQQARACVWGTKQFQSRYPGINCNIEVAELQWCPGDNWRQQQYFNINDGVIRSIYTRFGGAATPVVPVNGGGFPGHGGPGF